MALLAGAVLGEPAAAGCPRFEADAAIRASHAAAGSLGRISATFASDGREAHPGTSCAELTYDLDVGVVAGYRTLTTPDTATQSVSLGAEDVAGSDVGLRLSAARHRDAAGGRSTELSQHVALPDVALAGAGAVDLAADWRWRRTDTADDVTVAVGNAFGLAGNDVLSLRGGLDLRHDRQLGTTAVVGQSTSLAIETDSFDLVAGRSGSVRPGWQNTYRIEIRATDAAAAPVLRRAGLEVARSAGRTDTIAAWTGWSLAGFDLALDGHSSDRRHWSVGLDWQLVDATAGVVSLSADYARTSGSAAHAIGLTGELVW